MLNPNLTVSGRVVDKTWIFRNSAGKRPLELIFGEFFTARRAEYEFDIFELFSDFSGSFFFGRLFCSFFGWNRRQRTAKIANLEKFKKCSGQFFT